MWAAGLTVCSATDLMARASSCPLGGIVGVQTVTSSPKLLLLVRSLQLQFHPQGV
jgi:hypothetical protein